MNEQIRKLTFFNKLRDDEMLLLQSISKISKHPKGSVLYYESDIKDKIFFLVEGLLKVYKVDKHDNEIFLYHIYKNSLISELTTIEDGSIHCLSNTEFMEDSIVLEIDFSAFRDNFLATNILNNEFINEILAKTMQLHCVVNRELVLDATAKVAFMLCDDLAMFNSLKRHEVSFMLHIQPETLSRVLSKLKREAIIDIQSHNNIVVLDRDKLKAIYRGE